MRFPTILIFILVFNLAPGSVRSQDLPGHRLYNPAPRFALKSNILYDVALGPNLALEVKLGKRYTLDVPINYNPFGFKDNRKLKHILVQPELRYWLCEAFTGHFFGLHGMYSKFNIGNINVFQTTKEHRYEGWLAGGGLSWGYHFLLSPRWSLETTIGLGYAYIDYSKYQYQKCGLLLKENHKHYVGPTKIGVNLIYIIK